LVTKLKCLFAVSSGQNQWQLGFELGGFDVGHDLEVFVGAEAAGHALGQLQQPVHGFDQADGVPLFHPGQIKERSQTRPVPPKRTNLNGQTNDSEPHTIRSAGRSFLATPPKGPCSERLDQLISPPQNVD